MARYKFYIVLYCIAGLLLFQKKHRKRITIAFSLITSIHLQNEAKQNEALDLFIHQ